MKPVGVLNRQDTKENIIGLTGLEIRLRSGRMSWRRWTKKSIRKDMKYMTEHGYKSTKQCNLLRRFWMNRKYGILKRLWGFKEKIDK